MIILCIFITKLFEEPIIGDANGESKWRIGTKA